MQRDYQRSDRVADQIQRELSGLIRDALKDPRVPGLTTISQVQVSRDLSLAKVYVTIMGSQPGEARDEAVAALNRAAGFLRSRLAAQLSLRSVPQLRFAYDEVIERGNRLDDLIDEALRADRHERGADED